MQQGLYLTYRPGFGFAWSFLPTTTSPLGVTCSGSGTASAFLYVPFSRGPEAVSQMPTGGEIHWPPLGILRGLSVIVCKNSSVMQGISLQAI